MLVDNASTAIALVGGRGGGVSLRMWPKEERRLVHSAIHLAASWEAFDRRFEAAMAAALNLTSAEYRAVYSEVRDAHGALMPMRVAVAQTATARNATHQAALLKTLAKWAHDARPRKGGGTECFATVGDANGFVAIHCEEPYEDERFVPTGDHAHPSLLNVSALPATFTNISAGLIDLINDRVLRRLLRKPHDTCDASRHATPPAPPRAHTAPPPPPQTDFERWYEPMLWTTLGTLAPLGLLAAACGVVRRKRVAVRRSVGSATTALQVNRALSNQRLIEDGSGGEGGEDRAALPSDDVGWTPPASNNATRCVRRRGGGRRRRRRRRVLVRPSDGGADAKARPEARFQSLAMRHPLSARLLISAAHVGNAAFYLYANVIAGATVHVLLTVGGTGVELPGVYDFGLVDSIQMFWQSKSYPLSILIAVFCLVLTYLRIAVSAALYWMPPSVVRPRTRGLWLRLLDATGKWCLIDTQMLILLMVALHFDLRRASDDPVAADLVNAQVETTPDAGVNGFICAVLVSIVLTHIVLNAHRAAQVCDERARTRLYARELAGAAVGMLGDATGGGGGDALSRPPSRGRCPWAAAYACARTATRRWVGWACRAGRAADAPAAHSARACRSPCASSFR